MLTGEAKVAYQREYMRRKRAGLPTATNPKPKEWQPSERMIYEIGYWDRLRTDRPRDLRGFGARVIAGLMFDNDESLMEACRRYKAITDERRAARKAAKEREKKFDEESKILHCSFCRKPMSETGKPRWFATGYERRDGTKAYDAIICEPCVTTFAKKFAKQKKRKKQTQETHDNNTLELLGLDPIALSQADKKTAIKLNRRISACDLIPGAAKRRTKAIVDWQAFAKKHARTANTRRSR
jgi:hypothetical protein